jgi:hypothetical protein
VSKVDISSYIVPWALPNEKMPMHVTWSSGVSFDKILVKLPSDFKVVDVLNVDEAEITENEIMIRKVKPPLEGFPSFFGIVMTSPKIFKELKMARKIIVEFLRKEKTLHCLELYARIFRPLIEAREFPREIELFDQPEKNKLPLHLRYTGFGDVEVRFEAKFRGRIVSMGESIVYELLRRLWLSDIIEKTSEKPAKTVDKEKETRKRELWVDPAYIRAVAQKLEEKIEAGIIPTEELDAEAIADLREWLSDVRAKDRFMEILYEKTESMLLDLLVDLLERNPTGNVKLANARTMIRTRIKVPVTKLDITIRYKDKVGNDYPPIEIPVLVQDRRTEKGGMLVEMPIQVEKWESEPFMNVEKMESLVEG